VAGTTGKVTVGTLLVAAPVLVPRAVARFKERHPNHTVSIREGTSATLLVGLQRGEIDLVVGRPSTELGANDLRFEPFYSEPMCIVARRGHPFARRRGTKLAALAQATWIVPTPETAYRARLEAAFRQGGVEPPLKLVESMSILINTMLVQETDMLGVMPRDLAGHYARLGRLAVLPVKLPPPSGPVGVITVPGRLLPPAATDLVQALREAARELKAA
jgi:DNA-binding transcriptional LysR family regulator